MNRGRWEFNSVANMSISGVPQTLKIRSTISGWRDHSVGMGWFGGDRWSAITFRQPGICLARTIMFRASNQRKRATVKHSKVGERVPPCLLIYETTVELSVAIITWWPWSTGALPIYLTDLHTLMSRINIAHEQLLIMICYFHIHSKKFSNTLLLFKALKFGTVFLII